MQRERINRRIAALEMQHEPDLRAIVVFCNLDGTVQHGETIYADLDAAKAANPGFDTWVVLSVQDMSKP